MEKERPRDRDESLDHIFTARELLELTEEDFRELDELDGDIRAQGRWWRARRASKGEDDA